MLLGISPELVVYSTVWNDHLGGKQRVSTCVHHSTGRHSVDFWPLHFKSARPIKWVTKSEFRLVLLGAICRECPDFGLFWKLPVEWVYLGVSTCPLKETTRHGLNVRNHFVFVGISLWETIMPFLRHSGNGGMKPGVPLNKNHQLAGLIFGSIPCIALGNHRLEPP